ncbi:hypothetical protein HYV50_00865 [Candidatus Pacearchaeota archaeon]|nr:hypothetical protein [Candidatus Pacearchaeota archaeon]
MKNKIIKMGLAALVSFSSACTVPYDYHKPIQILENKKQNQDCTYKFSACNDYGDLNGDGNIKIPNELIGIKNNFFTNEHIRFASNIDNCIGNGLAFRLYDDKGILIEQGKRHRVIDDNYYLFSYYAPGWLASGEYTGKWFLNERHIGEIKINVFNKEEQKKESIVYSTRRNDRDQNEFFAANYWSDLNGNKRVDYPGEITGQKTTFSKNENIMLMCRIFNQTGNPLELRLYEFRPYEKTQNNKRKIEEIEELNYGKIQSNDWFAWHQYAPGRLNPGHYGAAWSINWKVIGTTRISVIDNIP